METHETEEAMTLKPTEKKTKDVTKIFIKLVVMMT